MNITGLAIGISVCCIIALFVKDELSFDRYNDKADRIFRIVFKANINGGRINESTVMPPVAQTLKNEFPEVEEATRIRQYSTPKVVYGEKTFKEGQFAFVDANFFQVFTLPLINGDANNALAEPNTIVLSEDLARKYFGSEDPLGKVLTFANNNAAMTVTGVMKNIPAASHFHFDMLGSMTTLPEAKQNTWMASNFFTYLVLRKGHDYKKLEAKLPSMVEKYMGSQILQEMGMSLSQFRTKGNNLGFALQPLTSIHLYSNTTSEFEPGGDARYIYIFCAIAVFMLLLACINFVNLSTAGAAKRAKEVGVRKVIGSGKWQLVKQFLLESICLSFLAVALSLLMMQLALPVFNSLSGKNLHLRFNGFSVAALTALGVLVGIAAGGYPAFFLASFKPIVVLKSKAGAGAKSFGLRSALVVFQFFISVSLMVSTIVVYQQMKFIRNKKLGYDKAQLLVLPNSWALGKNETVFKEQLLGDPRIVAATVSSYRPAGPSDNNNALAYPEGKESQLMKTIEYGVDDQYIPTLGMQMAVGRNFSDALKTDSSAMIINETAAAAFGWGANAVGQKIVRENSVRGRNAVFTVIGVVKDFHFKSLHEPITPLLMVLQPQTGLILKIKTADVSGLLASLKQQWAAFNTDEPFTFSFMDDLYNKTYAAEQKTGQLLNIFALLTILVACLGLFGLATYTAEQRTKEIGIRKVLGASVTQVTGMLSKEFIRLVLLACVASFPLSYWAMYRWLQDFAYRVTIGWWVFGLAAVAALLIALFTVSFQAIKAAIANPVKSLRTD